MNKNKLNNFIKKFGLTTDFQLKDIAKKLKINLKYVGFAENFEHLGNGAYIINLGDDTGSHWSSLFIEKDDCFYFDSFCAPPEDILINKLKGHCKNLIYNDYFQFQNIDELLCGVYCIIFLYHMTHSKKKELIDRFKELTKNYIDLDGDYSSGITLSSLKF